MNSELKKMTERNLIYSTAPKCPFCGGAMLLLEDDYRNRLNLLLQEHGSGDLRACSSCGIVRFYPDKES